MLLRLNFRGLSAPMYIPKFTSIRKVQQRNRKPVESRSLQAKAQVCCTKDPAIAFLD